MMGTKTNETLLEELEVDDETPGGADAPASNEFSDLADTMLSDEDAEEGNGDAADEMPDPRPTDEAEDWEGGAISAGNEPAPVEPTPPTPEAPPAEGAVLTEPTQPPEEGVPTPPVEQPAAVESPAVIPPTEPREQQDFTAMREAALKDIEARYTIPEEDVQLLALEPEKVLPKIAARLYVDAFENISRGIMSALPQMIQQAQQTQEAAQKNEQEFFGKWDGKLDAKNAKHRDTVVRVANVYSKMNPGVTRDQFIAEVGAQALMALGIPFEQIVDVPQPETPPTAFRPVKPGGVTSPPKGKPTDAWGGLAEEFIIDDSVD